MPIGAMGSAKRPRLWPTPVALDDEVAQMWRRRAERRRAVPPPEDAPDRDRIILEHLDHIDAGQVDAWWRLNVDLIYDKNGRGDLGQEIEADLTRLDGWSRADERTRERIIAAAHRYLDLAPPDPNDWLGKSTINRPAFAGYRALLLLAMHRPAQLEALDADTWIRWMPIIVSYPRSSGTDDERFDDVVLALAADRAPDALAQWTMRMVYLPNGQWRRPPLRHLRGCETRSPRKSLKRSATSWVIRSSSRRPAVISRNTACGQTPRRSCRSSLPS